MAEGQRAERRGHDVNIQSVTWPERADGEAVRGGGDGAVGTASLSKLVRVSTVCALQSK